MQYSKPSTVPAWFAQSGEPGERFTRVSCCTVPCGDYIVSNVVSNINARRTSYLGKLPYGWAFLVDMDSTALYLVAYHHASSWRDLVQQIEQCREGYDLMVGARDGQSTENTDTVDAVWI